MHIELWSGVPAARVCYNLALRENKRVQRVLLLAVGAM